MSASAGSGKTKVLIDRLLRLLLTKAEPHRILALTFTKAAAAEMANRLNRTLSSWAVMAPQDLAHKLEQDLLGRPPSDEELTSAQSLFAEVLDTPGGMKIQTIHAFCQSLLGRFPVESHTPARFQLMDERATAELFKAEISAMMQDMNRPENSVLLDALADISEAISDLRFQDLMKAAVDNRAVIRRSLANGPEAALAQLAQQMGLEAGQTPQSMIAQVLSMEAVATTQLRPAWHQLMDIGTKAFKTKLEVLQPLLDGTGDVETLWPQVCKVLLKSDQNEIATHNFPSTKILDQEPAAVYALRAYQALVLQAVQKQRSLKLFQINRAFLILAQDLLNRFDRAKLHRGELDFDDLIHRAGDLLRQTPTASQWVHYKLDQGIDHILVDEAQDTNPEQWYVIQGLADLFFDQQDADRHRTLFVVGDEKQSIYSFQGADPRKFSDMRAYFHGRAQAADQTFHDLTLDLSFRSTLPVLQAVNQSFGQAAEFKGVVAPNSEAWPDHKASRAQVPGQVTLWPLFETQKPKEQVQGWLLPTEPQKSDDGVRDLAQALAAQIGYWCYGPEGDADPECYLPTKDGKRRRIQPGDIMVLVRSRSRFVDDLTALLKANKPRVVEVAGRDRMRLMDQLAVQDLMALARFLVLPEDDLTLASLLKSPLLELSEDQLFQLAYNRGEDSLWRRLRNSDVPEIAQACSWLRECLARTDTQPLYELFVWVLGLKSQALLHRLGPDAEDAIAEFLALTLDYDAQHPPSLQGFLHWFEASDQDVKRDLEQENNKLRIMTIHGSKGLQAPIVVLPLFGKGGGNQLKLLFDPQTEAPLWVPRQDYSDPLGTQLKEAADTLEEEEGRRLLYVAMTRAEDRLLVCGATRTTSAPAWYSQIEQGMIRLGAETVDPIQMPAVLENKLTKPPVVWAGHSLTDWALSLADQQAESSDTQAAETDKISLPDWVKASLPQEPSPPRPMKPSEPELDAQSFASGQVQRLARQRGIVVHQLLQSLPELPFDQRQQAAKRYLKRFDQFDESQQDSIFKQAHSVLNAPYLADIFGPLSQAEVSLSGRVGERLITGRIDRLVVRDDQVLFVDFKTGHPGSAAAHQAQLNRYAEVLKRIYPNHKIRGFLIWTQTAEIEELPT